MQTPAVASNPGSQQPLAFRQATIERSDILVGEVLAAYPTVTTRYERQVEGSGYVFGIELLLDVTTAGNGATVAFYEDAPWSAWDTVVFRDVNGELLNLQGYDLYLANLIDHQYRLVWADGTIVTPNVNLYRLVTGVGAGIGGSFRTFLRVPIATNRRDLVGLSGNQDRAQKYSLRDDLAPGSAAATGPIYTTAPTTQGVTTVTRYYESYSVPLPVGPTGQRQASIPPTFGTLHFTTATISDSQPVGGATVNHYLRRLGNTIRWIALVFRSNGTRANAAATPPSNIQLKVGDDVIFNEDYNYRRMQMFERWGYEFPNGVLVYDALHDFVAGADYEMGYDYLHTQAIVNAQFQITYPVGFGSTNNTLKIITDDLQQGIVPSMNR